MEKVKLRHCKNLKEKNEVRRRLFSKKFAKNFFKPSPLFRELLFQNGSKISIQEPIDPKDKYQGY